MKKTGQNRTLAQLVERFLDLEDVGGSSLSCPTKAEKEYGLLNVCSKFLTQDLSSAGRALP